MFCLVAEFGSEELTIESSDVGQAGRLRTLGSASTGVGAVTEAEFIHLGHHGFCTLFGLNATLRKESQLADLGCHYLLCTTILRRSMNA